MQRIKHHSLLALVTLVAFIISSSLTAQLPPRSISSLDRSAGLDRPLALDEAFPYYLSVGSENSFTVTWNPAPGHYLYRHAFAFSLQLESMTESQSLPFSLPDGMKKTDQFFGDIEAYYDQVAAEIQLETESLEGASLIIEYQGCADWGFCYPPQRTALPLSP